MAMNWDGFRRLGKKKRRHFRRCPGCGGMLDERETGEWEGHRAHTVPSFAKAPPRAQQTSPTSSS
jgi:hypothetical protein